MNLSSLARRTPAVLGLALLLACGDDEPAGPSTPSMVRAVSARSKVLSLGAQESIVVRVENPNGRPLAGIPVTFTATNEGALSTTSATTGSDGTASTMLTINNVDDPTVVTATVEDVTQALTFKFIGQCPAAAGGMIDNFCGQTSLQGWTSFGPTISLSRGALRATGTVGGAGQFQGFFKALGGNLDFTTTQKVTVRMRNATTSSGPAHVQIALNDASGRGANKFGSVAGGLVMVVPNDGEWHTYTYDFTGKWTQWDEQPVDRTKIKEAVFLINPNTAPPWSGTLDIDDISRGA